VRTCKWTNWIAYIPLKATRHSKVFRPMYTYYLIQWNYSSTNEILLSLLLCCRNWCFIFVICILRRLVSNTLVFASFNRSVSGHTSGTGTDYTSGTPALTLVIYNLIQPIFAHGSFYIVLIYNLVQLISPHGSLSIIISKFPSVFCYYYMLLISNPNAICLYRWIWLVTLLRKILNLQVLNNTADISWQSGCVLVSCTLQFW
jgi:hypothetical protein